MTDGRDQSPGEDYHNKGFYIPSLASSLSLSSGLPVMIK